MRTTSWPFMISTDRNLYSVWMQRISKNSLSGLANFVLRRTSERWFVAGDCLRQESEQEFSEF